MGPLALAMALTVLDAEPAYPAVYCGVTSGLSGRWEIQLDPQTDADERRAERLLEHYPEADGVQMGLARSNLPTQWQGLTEVELVNEHGAHPTSVRTRGVRVSPSSGRFVMVLDAKPAALDGEFALAVEGSYDPDASFRRVRRDASDVDLGVETTMDVRRWLRMSEARGTPLRDPTVWFDAYGAIDLDGDGNDELVVREHWPEGLFYWLVRRDQASGELTATRLCGDAA